MKLLQLQTLGSFVVLVQGAPVTQFRSDKIRALLLYLALESGRVHHREFLAELLWPEMVRTISLRNLRKSLSRLRQTLGAAASEELLITTRQTISLDPGKVAVDLLDFSGLLAAAGRHHHETLLGCPVCLQRLDHAVSIYNGPFLQSFHLADTPLFNDWLHGQREAAQQQYLQALASLTAAAIERSDWAAGLRYGQLQISCEPWHEAAHCQLMQIHAGMGQPGAVQRQFESCRRLLQEALHVSPAPATVALYQQLVAARTPAPVQEAGPQPLRLPRQFTSFIGRTEALAEIDSRLDNEACALLTLLGPGGIGKTRVAIETARRRALRYRHGVLFVSLESIRDPVDIPDAILKALDLPLGNSGDSQSLLLNYLREKDLLLVLDNMEHLLAGAALILKLLQAAPAVKILVTSRMTLNLRAEWLYELGGLPTSSGRAAAYAPSAASHLFLDRLAQVNDLDSLSKTNLANITHICQLVEGLPLAIELAASQARFQGIDQVAAALTDSMDAIETTMIDVPDRHRSMRALFAYSWQMLDEAERKMLLGLSIFEGGFAAEAAADIVAASVSQLDALQEKSFLQQSAEKRFAMHAILRQYVREAAAAAGLLEPMQARHSAYYLNHLAQNVQAMVGAQGEAIMGQLQHELANILLAWQHACEKGQLASLDKCQFALAQLLHLRGLTAIGERAFAAAIAALAGRRLTASPDEIVNRLLAQLHNNHARFLLNLGELQRSTQAAETALELARAGAFSLEEASALIQLGVLQTDQSQYEQAHKLHDAAEAILNQISPAEAENLWALRDLRATNYKQRSDAFWAVGDFAAAERCLQDSLQLDRAQGDIRGEASCLHRQGIIARIQGDHDRALATLSRSLSLARLAGYSRLQFLLRSSIALAYTEKGDNEAARGHFQNFYQTSVEIGDLISQSTGLINLGLVSAREGAYQEARGYYDRALQLARQTQNRRNEGILTGNLGIIALRLGEFAEARQLCAESLAIRLEINDRTGERYARFYLARLALLEGKEAEVISQSQQLLTLADSGVVRDIDNLARTCLAHAYARRQQWGDARRQYEEAMANWQKAGQEHLKMAPLAGLARLAMLQDDLAGALVLVEAMLPQIGTLNLESTFEPFDIWLTCADVLRQTHDVRYHEILAAAYTRLWQRASLIMPAESRDRFLQAIPAHAQIRRLAQTAGIATE
ncbi:MAG: tetratricopeptide repeat protein [Anaerolineales bacterium]|nr:tetratricopeptide repeat protein [Anaerolineales bacterium]